MAIGDAKQNVGTDIRALLRAGLGHHNAGRLDAAEQAYLAALAGDRENSDAHNLLCALCLQRGEHERALAHGKSAVAVRTDIPLYWNNS